MKQLYDCKSDIQKCSKCGLCQASCPLFKVTLNDCAIPRGQLTMLEGLLKKELKRTSKIKQYLDLCLNCGKCVPKCPGGVSIPDIIALAKFEYVKNSFCERFLSFLQKVLVLKLLLGVLKLFSKNKKSEKFSRKVIYFGGCKGKIRGNFFVVQLLNKLNIEVVSPDFECCGNPFLIRGDLKTYNDYIDSFINIVKKYDIKEVVTSCVGCEKNLRNYIKWVDDDKKKAILSELTITNIYEYAKEFLCKRAPEISLNITYHMPCSDNNFLNIEDLLQSIKNVNYIQMNEYDSCCGLNGFTNLRNIFTVYKIIKKKRKNIINSKAKYVLTTCFGCEILLKSISLFKYKTVDLLEFLVKYTID